MKKLTVALVSCASKKLAVPAKAAELYTSDLFRKSRTYAERNADRWLILSAAHGLVAPTAELAPYDVTLSRMKAAEVRAWGSMVAEQLVAELTRLAAEAGVALSDVELVILAGEKYSAFRAAFETRLPAVRVSAPLAGLEIGERLAFLKRANEAVAENPVAAAREAAFAARDAFDAACHRSATLHLAHGYGVDREADKRAAVAAAEAIELARLAFRAATAAYQLELRRSTGLEVAEVAAPTVAPIEVEAVVAAPRAPSVDELRAGMDAELENARTVELELDRALAAVWSVEPLDPRRVELRAAAAEARARFDEARASFSAAKAAWSLAADAARRSRKAAKDGQMEPAAA